MKFEMHAHTFYSNDAIVSPEDLVKTVKNKGLNGVAVTDHNNTKGWKRAISAGKEHGIEVVKAEEIKVTHEGRKIGEVLVYFMNEEIKPGEFLEVKDKVKEQGALIAMAHPFDYFRNRFKMTGEYKKYFDAVETVNSRVIMDWFNAKAQEFARRNKIAVVGGSDSHCMYEVGRAHTEADVTDAEGLRKAILKKKSRAYGKKSNPFIHALSTITKFGFMRPKGI